MLMMRKNWTSYIYFMGISALIFTLHSLLRIGVSMDWCSAIMVQSYLLNVSLGLGLIAVANYLLTRASNYVGWAFIALSGLKFVLFFILIWPEIRRDGVTSSAEFASFFVPYLGCLLMELRFLAKRLNAL